MNTTFVDHITSDLPISDEESDGFNYKVYVNALYDVITDPILKHLFQ